MQPAPLALHIWTECNVMRFGTIGTNFIAREFLSAGEGLEGFSLAAVYSRDMERAKAFAGERPGVRCVTDINELAAMENVDGVYISSPNLFHAQQAELMLRAGKHVLLEKPACPDRETFASLRALAEEKGLVLLEAMRPAFMPGFAVLKKAIEEVGKVRRVSFTYCQYSSRYDAYKRGVVENAFNPALCNGSLMDIGVYCIHALVALFGMPERISAVANRLDNGLDSQGGVLCVYPEMLSELSWSKIADSRRSNEIQGEQGTLLIDSITNPKDIVFVGRDKSQRVIYHDPDPEFFNMKHEIRSFMDFAAASAEGSRPWESHNQVTEQVLALMDEIRSQTGIDFRNKHQ